MTLYALDCETHRIGPGAVAPRVICASVAWREGDEVVTELMGNHPEDDLPNFLEALLQDEESRVVTHNGGFDYACVVSTWPELTTAVFAALESGRLTDTLWREKLLNLSTTGKMERAEMPDGSQRIVSYSLASLQYHYLGVDRSAEKEDLEEGWRANYSALDGWRAEEYPEEAERYAREDAAGTLLVHEAQERRKAEWSMSSTETEGLRLATSFVLYLMTAWGAEVDPEAVAEMRRKVDEVTEANRDLLEEFGILRPGRPARPHAHDLERAEQYAREVLSVLSVPEGFDWSPHDLALRDLGVRMVEAKPGTIDTKALQAYAERLYRKLGQIPDLTDGGQHGDNKKIKLDAEHVEHLAAHDPVMEQYQARQELAKLRTNQLPVLESAPVIHFPYDALKGTGRTSSYASDLFPSTNGQQVPKEIGGIDPRRCYRPREGTVFLDCDLSVLELACVGQTTYDLFGESVHLERYNAGVDLHAYLGAQLLVMSGGAINSIDESPDGVGRHFSGSGDPMVDYRNFVELKTSHDEEWRKVYKHYRNLAKPIGLGFPGGIGPEKMVTLARQQYGVHITEDQARALRERWREVYPEMPRYFRWVESQVDTHNIGQNGETLHWYQSRLGMIRRGASYCAAANGCAMQTPGAEAAEAGLWAVVRACHDPSVGSVLYGCRPIWFVHDQVIAETTRDRSLWHEQAEEASRLMCEWAKVALPDVKMRSEALLTTIWSKSAEPVRDESGRLVPWRPE